MATVTQAAAPTFSTTGGANTLTATPELGDLIVVFVMATGIATGLGVTDNNTDGHGTYRPITSALKNASADLMSAFVRADPIRRAVATIWTTSGDGASSGGGIAVYRISGLQLSALQAVRASGVIANGAAAATPAPALGQAALTANPLVGAVFNGTSPATMTPPTSWTEDADVGYTIPTAGLETVHINSAFTGSTVTWGSTSASAFCAIAVELSAAAAGHMAVEDELRDDPFSVQTLDRVSVNRGSFFCFGDKWARRGRLWVPACS